MPVPERLKNDQTPARVLALCRLTSRLKGLEKSQLGLYMQPDPLNSSKEIFGDVFSFAKEMGLIAISQEGKVYCGLKDTDLATAQTFRKALASRIFAEPGQIFCQFTAWYLQRGERVYREGAADLERAFQQEISSGQRDLNEFNRTNIIGWRTWASFLGYGFVHRGFVVPNVAERLQDVLEEDKGRLRGEKMDFSDFMSGLANRCPELDGGQVSLKCRGSSGLKPQHLSIGLSAGLRLLHDRQKITLINTNDAIDLWYLTRVDNHELTDRVSHISVGGL